MSTRRPDHEVFEAFYQDVRGRLLLQTWSLTGDLPAAQKAVRDALVITWHHWRKVRRLDDAEREDWVRPIAWGRALRRHSVPHLHRDQALTPDVRATLTALRELPVHERKAFLLGHLTSVTLAQLAREVGVPMGRTETDLQHANAEISQALNVAPQDLRTIFEPLAEVSAEQPWPKAANLTRSGGIRRRTHTAVGAAVAVAALVGAGFFVSSGNTTSPRLSSLSMESARQAFAKQVTAVPGKKLTSGDLVSNAEMDKVLGGRWAVDITSDNLEGSGLRVTCQEATTADPRPVASLARTFVGSTASTDGGVTMETSASEKAAAAAYQKELKWYAGCAEPRYQLVFTKQIKSLGDEAMLFGFRDLASPQRSVMFGVARSGRHTTAVTTKVTGSTRAAAGRTVTLLGTAVQHVCSVPGRGACASPQMQVSDVPALAVGDAPGLLGVTDLPPVKGVSAPWEATKATAPKVNNAATRCDNTSFASVSDATTRSFLVPTDTKLDPTFGLTETAGKFKTTALATGFTSDIRKALQKCGKKELGSHVSQLSLHASSSRSVGVWSVRVEIGKNKSMFYLMAVVRQGATVAQIGFVPDGRSTIDDNDFVTLAGRAADRLAYL
ncbi:MAG: hypothetical protein J2O46_03625 [Nocardioides sp.]|nr:hypothetical protein [Nocardioides sp.]